MLAHLLARAPPKSVVQKESSEFGSVQRSDPPSLPPRDSHDQLELDDLEMYNTENLEELELKLQEEED